MAKTTVENCLTLDINRLNRDSKGNSALRLGFIGTIDWSDGNKVSAFCFDTDGNRILRLNYIRDDEKVDQDIVVEYTILPKNGKRPWFRCPATKSGVPCVRRVGRLYLPPWGKIFACRHCYELAYASQQEWGSPKMKALFRSLELHDRLDRWNAGKKMTNRQYDQFMKTYHKLSQNLRKAGIVPDGYKLPEW